MFENEYAKQTKQKSYIKHTAGSFSLGKSSCQQAINMEIAEKSARASASYKHVSDCTAVNLWLSTNTALNLAKLSMHSKKKIYAPASPSVCSDLSYSTWKLSAHLAAGHCSPETGQCRSQNNFPSSSSPPSYLIPQLRKKAIMPSLWIFRCQRDKI